MGFEFISPIVLWWVSLVAQMVKNLPAPQETWVQSLGRSSGEGNDKPLQYSCLENSKNRGYNSWDHKELDMTEQLTQHRTIVNKEAVLNGCRRTLQLYIWAEHRENRQKSPYLPVSSSLEGAQLPTFSATARGAFQSACI